MQKAKSYGIYTDGDGLEWVVPIKVDVNGNMGVNLEGEIAVGTLALGATDAGLVALATSIKGSKQISDLYTMLNNVEDNATYTHYLSVKSEVLANVFDTITHSIGVQVKGVRALAAGCTAHRASLTAPDLLGGLQTAPTVPTFADSGVAEGSLTHAPTTYYGGYVIRNGLGVTMASAIASVALSNANSIRMTIPAGVWRITDADAVYEIFLSTDAAPKHVCTFTAAQLAASGTASSGCVCTTAEIPVTNSTARAAWACDIGVVGTNVPTNNATFAQSTAYTIGAISPVVTTGYNNVDVFVDAQPTAYTTITPALTLVPVYLNDKQGTNYHVGAPIAVSLAQGSGQSFRQLFNLTTNGASVIVLVSSIANVTINRIDVTPTSMV